MAGAARSQHKAFAFNYIAKFSQQEKGTGGSDFMVRAAASVVGQLWRVLIGGW